MYEIQGGGIEDIETTFQSATVSVVAIGGKGMATKKSDKELVSVETDVLKERLNKLYQSRRGHGHRLDSKAASATAFEGMFEYLWDLKEKALLERRPSVEVPRNWLDQLEEQGEKRH